MAPLIPDLKVPYRKVARSSLGRTKSYSAVTPARFTTSPHRFTSACTKLPNCFGVISVVRMPSSTIRAWISGSFMMRRTSALNLATTGAGVPAGAKRDPLKDVIAKLMKLCVYDNITNNPITGSGAQPGLWTLAAQWFPFRLYPQPKIVSS